MCTPDSLGCIRQIAHADCVELKMEDHGQFDTAGEPILSLY